MLPFLSTRRMAIAIAILAGATVALAAPVNAQTAVRVRANVVSLDGDRLTIRTKDNQEMQVRLVEPVAVSARVRAEASSIKSGDFVGAAAMPGKDGALAGVEVVIFPEALRGTGEGHRPFDLMPESTMTNATVADEVVATDGKTLKLTYKGGEQRLALTPDTRVFTIAPGSLADLKPGAAVNLSVDKGPSGDLQTRRVSVDR